MRWDWHKWIISVRHLVYEWLSFPILGHLVKVYTRIEGGNTDGGLVWVRQVLKSLLDGCDALVKEASFVGLKAHVYQGDEAWLLGLSLLEVLGRYDVVGSIHEFRSVLLV